MHQLIYVSHECVPFESQDLKRLLTRSRIRNIENGLTGLLIYCGGWFLQALEGEEQALKDTFGRIERDVRHEDLRVLRYDRALAERAFGQWSMGYPDFSIAAQLFRGFINVRGDLSLASLNAAQAATLLTSCAKTGRVVDS